MSIYNICLVLDIGHKTDVNDDECSIPLCRILYVQSYLDKLQFRQQEIVLQNEHVAVGAGFKKSHNLDWWGPMLFS